MWKKNCGVVLVKNSITIRQSRNKAKTKNKISHTHTLILVLNAWRIRRKSKQRKKEYDSDNWNIGNVSWYPYILTDNVWQLFRNKTGITVLLLTVASIVENYRRMQQIIPLEKHYNLSVTNGKFKYSSVLWNEIRNNFVRPPNRNWLACLFSPFYLLMFQFWFFLF